MRNTNLVAAAGGELLTARDVGTAFTFDPFAAGFTDDPYPHYARLRATAPAYAHLNVSFGGGAQHCLGAGLARLEAEVAFAGFARRFPAADVAAVRCNGRVDVRGPAALSITVR